MSDVMTDPAEESLRREFDAIVGALVGHVHQTATETVRLASDGIQAATSDLRTASREAGAAAGRAKESVAPVADLVRAVEMLRQTVERFDARLTAIESRLGVLTGKTEAIGQRSDERAEATQTTINRVVNEFRRSLNWGVGLLFLATTGVAVALRFIR